MASALAQSPGPNVRSDQLNADNGSTIWAGIINNYAQGAAGAPKQRNVNLAPTIHSAHFLGRDGLLEEINKYFEAAKPATSIIALWGMGGVGKTQCALEYCRRRYQIGTCSVFWANAQTAETLQLSFRDMAGKLSLPRDDPVSSINSWLDLNHSLAALFVFDNVTDADLIRDYLPTRPVDVILTTRDSALVGSEMVPWGVEIKLLDPEDALRLFLLNLGSWDADENSVIRRNIRDVFAPDSTTAGKLSKTYKLSSFDQIEPILEIMGQLPLAIVQCASYLRQYRVPFQKYIEKFRANAPESRKKFYSYSMRGATYAESVMTTWDISFQSLDQEAVKMMTLFGFLGRNQINVNFLEQALEDCSFWGGKGKLTVEESTKDFFSFLGPSSDLYESIGQLDSLSLITRDADLQHIYVHPMIHEYIHLRISPPDTLTWLFAVTSLLYQNLPPLLYSSKDLDAPQKAEQVFLHLDRAMELLNLYSPNISERFYSENTVLFFLEAYLWYRGSDCLILSEKLASNAPECINEMIQTAKAIHELNTFFSSPEGAPDKADHLRSFFGACEIIQRFESKPIAGERIPLVQAILSDRMAQMMIQEGRKYKELDQAKFPLMSWLKVALGSSPTANINSVCGAVLSLCTARVIKNVDTYSSGSIFGFDTLHAQHKYAFDLLRQNVPGAVLGLKFECQELKGYFDSLLAAAERQIWSVQENEREPAFSDLLSAMDKIYAVGFGHVVKHQWSSVERVFRSMEWTAKIRDAVKELVQKYESLQLQMLGSNVFLDTAFTDLGEAEAWVRANLTAAEHESSTAHTVLKLRKLVLAEILTTRGTDLEEAHVLFQEVFSVEVTSDGILGKGLASFVAKVLLLSSYEPKVFTKVGRVFQTLNTPMTDEALVRSIEGFFSRINIDEATPDTVIGYLSEVLPPSWEDNTQTFSDRRKSLDILDKWGFVIVSQASRPDCSVLSEFRAYQLCKRIYRQLRNYLSLVDVRMYRWIAKMDDFHSIFGRFGTWTFMPVADRDISALTNRSLRMLQSATLADEVDDELVRLGFDEQIVRKSFRLRHDGTILSSLSSIPEPSFISLPLGRILRDDSFMNASSYHGPHCGLWIVSHGTSLDRATMFWSRSDKPGTHFVDIGEDWILRRYHSAWLVLEPVEQTPYGAQKGGESSSKFGASGIRYWVFQLHYNRETDWHFKQTGQQILNAFQRAGGRVADVLAHDTYRTGTCGFEREWKNFGADAPAPEQGPIRDC